VEIVEGTRPAFRKKNICINVVISQPLPIGWYMGYFGDVLL
jgi:hypothetical protein